MNFLTKKRPDTFEYTIQRTCPTCKNIFQGKFCNRCGEKVFEPNERSIRHFFGDLLNAFTFLDGKFPRSVKSILVNPGDLSANVAMGVRIPFMKPVSLFFVANFVYFLFPFFEVFNTSFNSQLRYQPYSNLVERMVENKTAELGISIQDFEIRYNGKSSDWAKLLIVIIVFLFSLVVSLINFSRNHYFADHLTVSFEFMSYTILYATIALSYMLYLVIKVAGWVGYELQWIFEQEGRLLLPTIVVCLLYFLWRMQIRFYKNHWFKALLKSLVLFAGFATVLLSYRFILFFVTYWSV